MPDTEIVEPVTAVTLPEAMSRFAKVRGSCWPRATRKARPSAALGTPATERNLDTARVRRSHRRRASAAPAGRRRRCRMPVELGVFTVRLRAATVVLDFFEASPWPSRSRRRRRRRPASVTVLENCVVPVQLTVVWPLAALCTSMLEALRARHAARPPPVRARRGGDAGAAMARPSRRRTRPMSQESCPAPAVCASAGRCLHVDVPLLLLLVLCRGNRGTFRVIAARASMGASWAARLAGYTPKSDADGEGDGQARRPPRGDSSRWGRR